MSRTDAVILAGGLGRRMHPLTQDCPKPLLPVGPWSLVEHQIAALARAGVGRVVLSTGYRHADFEKLVTTLRAKGVDLITVVEDTPLGTGGGLRESLRALPGAEAVIVLNGDLLTGHGLAAQVDLLRAAPPAVAAAVHVREVPDARPYGSVLADGDGRITAFVEKSPTPPSSTVNAGTYVVRPALLDAIPDTGAASLERDVFPPLAERGALLAHREDAYFLDVGSPAALVRATRDLLLAPWPGAAPTPRGESLVLPGAVVAPGARLSAGTVVHADARIGAGARLESAVVLPGARVDDHAEVVRSVLGRGARVGAGAQVVDSALGSGQQVAPGEHLTDAVRPEV
nr:NDP-sugar synthase [Janibacter cremeus]